MARPPEPLFLERRSYRRRRIGDAAKMLPVAGAVLFLMPVLWASSTGTAAGMVYLFLVWALLILVMVVLSRKLADEGTASGGPEGPGSGEG